MSTASKSDFAREHGVTPPSVANWIRKGFVVLNDEGRVEREISNRKLANRPMVYRGGRLGGNAHGSPWAGDRRTIAEWEVELLRATLDRKIRQRAPVAARRRCGAGPMAQLILSGGLINL
jgi:hypothetical protein